jgi:hypothetical protein
MLEFPRRLRALTALSTLLTMTMPISGCSDRRVTPAASEANDPAATEAAAEAARMAHEETQPEDLVVAELAAGGIPTKYSATFEDGQLQSLSEERKSEADAVRRGRYVFYGARLTEYSGAALHSDGAMELRFDMQGGLESSSGSAAETEISEIRNRAQLLRSHALARRSARGHGM